MLSTSQMIDKLAGLVGTNALSDWETSFVNRLIERKQAGEVTALTERQISVLERLHQQHFS